MPEYILKTKHINSKPLLLEISEFVGTIIDDYNIIWSSDSQRDAILEVIDEHMQDLAEVGKLEQWDVICDERNNKKKDMQNKITHLDIKYVQHNCYNISELNYTIGK